MVTIAWVASVRRVLEPTLALEVKFDSHSAFSPSLMGGISDGGAAGSKVLFAKLAGCFSITGSGAAVSPPGEKRPHPADPSTSVPRVTQSRWDKREGKAA